MLKLTCILHSFTPYTFWLGDLKKCNFKKWGLFLEDLRKYELDYPQESYSRQREQIFKQITVIQYNCYDVRRHSSRVENGILDASWQIRNCFIEKMVETSGKLRRDMGIWSDELEQEGGESVSGWGTMRIRHGGWESLLYVRHWMLLGAFCSFVTTGEVETEQDTEVRLWIFLHFMLKWWDSITLHLLPYMELI